MQRGDDEEAWRAIVDNFGDRVELDDDPAPGPVRDATAGPVLEPLRVPEPAAEARRAGPDDPDRFVPPDPDLPPRPSRDRQVAWAGLFGAPVLLLVLLLLGMRIPSLLAYALVIGFVGGFLYLVFHLPRSPDDPFDDGARV